jgi:hypothetical protein
MSNIATAKSIFGLNTGDSSSPKSLSHTEIHYVSTVMTQSNGRHKSNTPEQYVFPFEHLTEFLELQLHSFRTLHPLEKNNNFLFCVLYRSPLPISAHCRAAHSGITSTSRHLIQCRLVCILFEYTVSVSVSYWFVFVAYFTTLSEPKLYSFQ